MLSQKPRSYSVNDFLSWYRKGELVLQPKFQRRDVWSEKAQSYLIDTIIRGLPIPLIFVRQQIDPGRKTTVREVVDGQQRLRAVLNFCEPAREEDRVLLMKSHNPELAGVPFGNLPSDLQSAVLSYDFSVVLLEGATDEDILTIFARLNTYAQKLTQQELLNAEFSGQFKQTIYRLGYQHLTFWTSHQILTDAAILRMSEAELVSDLVTAMLLGLQNQKGQVKQLYAQYEDEFSASSVVERRFKHTMDIIGETYGNYLSKSLFRKKAVFYSLFCVIFDLSYGLPRSPTPSISKLTSTFTEAQKRQIREILLRIEDQTRSSEDAPKDIDEFKAASQRSVTDIKQRTTRHRVLAHRLQAALK
jgi:hypothetical protein